MLVCGHQGSRVLRDECLLIRPDIDSRQSLLRLFDRLEYFLPTLGLDLEHPAEQILELLDRARFEGLVLVDQMRQVNRVDALLGDVGAVEIDEVLILGEEHLRVRGIVDARGLVGIAAFFRRRSLLPRRLDGLARAKVRGAGPVTLLVRLVALGHELGVELVVLFPDGVEPGADLLHPRCNFPRRQIKPLSRHPHLQIHLLQHATQRPLGRRIVARPFLRRFRNLESERADVGRGFVGVVAVQRAERREEVGEGW